MIVLIDNYDSFTYNLVQYLEELGMKVSVFRNDKIDPEGISALRPEGLVLSPGPGTPDDAGVTLEAIAQLGGAIPILGVCLGHQAIAQCYGAKIVRAERVMHGRTSEIRHTGRGLYRQVPNPLTATRYHSLIVERESLPGIFEVTAETDQREIMGLRHRELPVEGVQFHPESFLTVHGKVLLANWLTALEEHHGEGS